MRITHLGCLVSYANIQDIISKKFVNKNYTFTDVPTQIPTVQARRLLKVNKIVAE